MSICRLIFLSFHSVEAKKMAGRLFTLFIFAVWLVGSLSAHSWIDCTDYREENGVLYSQTKCFGRPRMWQNHNSVFGVDTGYNHQSANFVCKYPNTNNLASMYNTNFPMATYRLGSRVCLAYPSKNHVAHPDVNNFIPDTDNRIFISSTANPTSDQWAELAFLGNLQTKNAGGLKGFQNCPSFVSNQDKSLCTVCFTVPNTLQVGATYSFQWRWVFNSGDTAYNSCWEAQIAASDGTVPTVPPTPPTPPSNPNPDPTPNTPLTGNSIRLRNPPQWISFATNKQITVTVEYSATASVDIVVDILKGQTFVWYGKGISKNVPAGTGSIDIIVQVQSGNDGSTPSEGNYILKPWIVTAGFGDVDKGWLRELDRKEYPVAFTTTSPPNIASNATSLSHQIMALCWMCMILLYLL